MNKHKNGFDILRSADASVFRSLKVYVLQSLEKTMIWKQLSNFTLSIILLNRYQSCFKFILMLAGNIEINRRPITMIDDKSMWDDLPFNNCTFLLTGLKINLVLPLTAEIVLTNGVCWKVGEYILFI